MNNGTLVNVNMHVTDASPFRSIAQNQSSDDLQKDQLLEILFVTSYPSNECGIATYSQDLLKALEKQFSGSFSLKVCALESGKLNYPYPDEVKYTLDTTRPAEYVRLVQTINHDADIKLVLVQHEFGLFQASEDAFLHFLYQLSKPAIVVFHTVLPRPDNVFKIKVRHIVTAAAAIIVMTKNAAEVLSQDYDVPAEKIIVIPHGTHLVPHLDKETLKGKHGLAGRKILSTFGLLNSGKSIETTLDALLDIVQVNPEVLFLIIGKTHPGVLKSEGETYRRMLEGKVAENRLEHHVKFINRYLPLDDLLEHLQMTDIYLFTSKDPNQAVSGTFSYAMSCGCPIISTPIPHAREVLRESTGIIIDFQNSKQLAESVNHLMSNEPLRVAFSENTLQQVVPTAWENSAIAHALLLQKVVARNESQQLPLSSRASIVYRELTAPAPRPLQYILPPINLEHVKKMTTAIGMIQFAKINQPDIGSGYTLDDNARALIAMCMHYEQTGDKADIPYICTYLNFIKFCLQPEGDFLNYVDSKRKFTSQNYETNLSDSNGRALWALGYLISMRSQLPTIMIDTAQAVVNRALPRSVVIATAEAVLSAALPHVEIMHSTRAMAFAIKGLYYCNLAKKTDLNTTLIKTLANRLVQMYRHESEQDWEWYESYLTYGNSILPEAMLCAYLETGEQVYKDIAKSSFDFLLLVTFNVHGIKVISNKTWLHKGQEAAPHGEQPIDVAYTILALSKFYRVFKESAYLQKMEMAFNWFLGNNHLNQIVYNPCTGGCYDGLEDNHVNLNQGAESTLSYLMARLTMEKNRV